MSTDPLTFDPPASGRTARSLPPREPLGDALRALDTILLGKAHALRLCMACLIARGHLLIEDVPGVGKTTLAHALARVLGLSWQRVQFTSDLLPADIIGVSVFDRTTQRFEFRKGPVFTQLLLADEVNRASPRTQSALLEAMGERQVSVDGLTHKLPEPFFVVATQNPQEQLGTFALPESQLDRFLMRIELGYPDPRFERMLLAEPDRREKLDAMPASMTPAQLLQAQHAAQTVHAAPALLDYVQALVAASRVRRDVALGLSPRAAQGLLRAARAWALIDGRRSVIPDDVQAVWAAIAGHRLQWRDAARSGASLGARPNITRELLESVRVPA
ncbi:MAG: MoxR family ATPase [Nevskiaceae bacterium]|jgi:MoxR-like ATPase|nr:MoxR family ATPase [Nevskiaceae bacterium]